jgi:mannose-1-phosphate guanylyltransferase
MVPKPNYNRVDISRRCAIVMAGGDGLRLRSFVSRLRGDALPKQYVKFFGDRSLLDITFHRAQRSIPQERIFTVVSQNHFEFPDVTQQLASRKGMYIVIQPNNLDTGIGLLLPLAHVFSRYSDSTVVVFPADHFVADEELFMTHVDAAFGIVERDVTKVILLGIEPSSAEPDYGYIVPEGRSPSPFPYGARVVKEFIEKPAPLMARKIVARGGLWNTLVMVFHAKTLLQYVRGVQPTLYDCFRRLRDAVGGKKSEQAVERVYSQAQPVNLSKGFLEELPKRYPSQLLVLPARGVHWSDWGSEERVVSGLRVAPRLDLVKERIEIENASAHDSLITRIA